MLHLKRGFTYFLCFNIIITSFPGWVFAALIQSHDESTTVLKARNQKTQLIYIATPNENGLIMLLLYSALQANLIFCYAKQE
jgi:hypothetical protein